MKKMISFALALIMVLVLVSLLVRNCGRLL